MTQDKIIEPVQEAGIVQFNDGFIDITKDELDKFAKLVAAKEREACAKLVDDIEARCVAKDVDDPPLSHVAAAIRERGTT